MLRAAARIRREDRQAHPRPTDARRRASLGADGGQRGRVAAQCRPRAPGRRGRPRPRRRPRRRPRVGQYRRHRRAPDDHRRRRPRRAGRVRRGLYGRRAGRPTDAQDLRDDDVPRTSLIGRLFGRRRRPAALAGARSGEESRPYDARPPAIQWNSASKLPIVYVRGYAGGTSGIDRAVDDPLYGFNEGSVHVRVGNSSDPILYQFESPLLRLIGDDGYRLIVEGSQLAYLQERPDGKVPQATIWVHRFYDVSASTLGRKPE